MKILYAIQGTGNGHLSRARDVYPELIKHGEVDVLISGIQADIDVPFPVKYRLYGMSFIFGRSGGVSIPQTLFKLRIPQLIKDMYMVPVEEYDLVINDFEPVTAWACKLRGLPCVGLSHQAAVLHPNAPVPDEHDFVGSTVLRHYAPVTTAYGFHFRNYGRNVFTPLIRKEIRNLVPTNKGHYTVYLPAFDDARLLAQLAFFPEVSWQVFSKHNKQPVTQGNISIRKIDNDTFIKSMASSAGVLCGAGFETPSEALHLGKKLMVLPMHGQYEQQCNAAALKQMGVPVIRSLRKEYHQDMQMWLKAGRQVAVNFPDMTASIVERLIAEHSAHVRLAVS